MKNAATKENEIRKNSASSRLRLEDIKVTIHIPENVNERVRQQKIDKIYDILSAKRTP